MRQSLLWLHAGKSAHQQRRRMDYGGLPVHLPNTAPVSTTVDINGLEETQSHIEEASLSKTNVSQPSSTTAVCIPGTSITLETDEDIAKWIEDRKRNWPSKKNVEEKKRRPRPPSIPQESPPAKRPRNVCRYFQQHGRCKFGKNCKNLHESAGSKGVLSLSNTKTINDVAVTIPQRFKKDSGNVTFYRKLVQRDHSEHENDKILNFILFLQQKNKVDHDVSFKLSSI